MSVVRRGYKGRHVWRTPQRRKALRGAALGAAVVGLMASMLSTPAAAVDETCATPLMREAMVSQGLPTYATLARNKSTLVKYFLSMPNGCDASKQYLTVTGGTLTIRNSVSTAAVSVPLPSESAGPISPYVAAPSSNSTGNPTFALKGTDLGPIGDGAPYSAIFTGVINYTVTDVTTGVPITSAPRQLNVASVSRTVDSPANPLRVLVVPIGDARRTFDTNFPTTARNYLASAMSTLGRLLPVADGVGSLSSTTAGIRYDVALSTSLVNVGPHDADFNPATPDVCWLDNACSSTTGMYCPSGGDFKYISAKLADAREVWNRANPNAPASRVLGVVWQGISRGASTDDETTTDDGSCVEGYADVTGTVAWSRIIDPHPGNPAQSSGSIATMELMHTMGSVPNPETNYHSLNAQADGTATDRAYNVSRRSFIPLDRSVMQYFYDAWHDDITLLEPDSWSQAACALSANAAQSASASACSAPATVGATAASAADRVHLAGYTDGTAAGTHAHTYVAPSKSTDRTDSASPYQLVYSGALGELSRTGVRVTFSESAHSDTGNDPGNGSVDSTTGIFDVAVVPPAGTTDFKLIKVGSPDVVLYGRSRNQKPAIQSVAAAADGAPVRYASLPDGQPRFPVAPDVDLSPDGSLIAWTDGNDVLLRRTNDRTTVPLRIDNAKFPSFANLSSKLVVTDSGGSSVFEVSFNNSGATLQLQLAPYAALYVSPRDAFGNSTAPVDQASYSPTDDRIVLASDGWQTGQLYVLSATRTCTVLGAANCTQLTTAGYAHDPSWGAPNPAHADGVIAFTDDTPYDGGSSSAIALIDPLTRGPIPEATGIPDSIQLGVPPTDRTVFVDDALAPDWGGTRLAFTQLDPSWATEKAVTVDGTTYGDLRQIADNVGPVSLSTNDLLIGYTVDESTSDTTPSHSALTLKSLATVNGEQRVEATDDTGRDLRLDVIAECPGINYPLITDVAPTTSSSGAATFQFSVQTAQLCPGAQLRYDVSDGFQIADPVRQAAQGAAGSAAAVGISTPLTGDTFLQYRSVPLAVNARDAAGAPTSVSYTIIGPGGTNRTGSLAAGSRSDLAPFTVPGSYTLTATAGGVTSASTFTVLEDKDADGIPASLDSHSVNPCLPLNADNDPRTAIVDYDGDFLVGDDDTSPCTTIHNTTVDLDANTLNGGSAGSKISFFVTSSSVNLSQFSAANIAITRIAGHYVRLPALSWAVDSHGVWMAKVDRQAFQDAVAGFGLKGFVPVLLQGKTASAAFSGIDPNDPTIR